LKRRRGLLKADVARRSSAEFITAVVGDRLRFVPFVSGAQLSGSGFALSTERVWRECQKTRRRRFVGWQTAHIGHGCHSAALKPSAAKRDLKCTFQRWGSYDSRYSLSCLEIGEKIGDYVKNRSSGDAKTEVKVLLPTV